MATTESYSYRAATPGSGQIVKGTMDAASEAAVVGRIRQQGLVPIEVRAVPKTGLRREIKLGRQRRVPSSALALFARQASSLVGAGLPLMRVLGILIEQTSDKTLRQALEAVRADVEAGAAFSAAMAKHDHAFPPLLVSLVRVGETGGFFDQSLASAATLYQADAELRDKVRAATTYPMVVLAVALLAVIAMVTFVVPVFEGMFASLGGELPLPTRILVVLSNNMVWILPLLIALVVVGGAWWVANRHAPRVRRIVDPLTLRLPLVGPLLTKIAVARFARNLSMMISAGVPLLGALETVSKAADNVAIDDALRAVRDSVRAGKSFAAPLAASGIFPPMVSQMVAVGEESGTLAEMLESVAEFYEAEAKSQTEQLTSVIEPALIVILGVLIGGMVIALYMPIFGIYGQLNQAG
ncbi:type II secretion system F family protein [Microbacterium sp. No. 7]|uniref:type II secretion system F family protein n=1 Tax=Microbacterium sp. No. 7 TaxID=1714373 RepID=UPI0006D19FD8|nr:type II secretion system F family protein [Microbacterium sp. No. 7]